MIQLISVLLVILLAGLLVDWRGILKKIEKKKGKKAAPSVRPAASPVAKKDPFPLDFPDETISQAAASEEAEAPYEADSEVTALLEKADVHFRKSEMKAAEELYVQAAAKDPRCSKAYSRLGIIYLENGENWDDAEACFRQALKTEPSNGYILNNLGLVLYHQDKYADAIRQFEQAVRLDEYNAARHANLGMAYMAMRQYAKAESSFKKALKLAPNEMEYRDLLNESIEKKKAHKTMVRR